jgi:hypothetical protein
VVLVLDVEKMLENAIMEKIRNGTAVRAEMCSCTIGMEQIVFAPPMFKKFAQVGMPSGNFVAQNMQQTVC